MRFAFVLMLSGMLASIAVAQEAPPSVAPSAPGPTGPAQIINRAGQAREQARLARSPAQTEPAPANVVSPAPTQAAPNTQDANAGAVPAAAPRVGGDPHAGVDGAPSVERLPLNSASENPELRPGTIRVRVLDAQDRSVANAQVQVGVMQSMGSRTTIDATTDAAGIALLSGLNVGEGQAYRVNVLHQGAKYSSNPFRLPVDHGYDVMVRQLDTTRSLDEVVLYIGALSIELQDERIKIVQQARLVNVGQRTYVFPERGQVIELPKGFLAFQAQDSMTDQHVTPIEGNGLRIEGSLAPGQATMTWGFDLPREGTEASFSIAIPWRTYAYRVLSDAAPGMQVEVEGMPTPQVFEQDGHRMLVTEVQAGPNQPMLSRVSVRMTGIPGPGSSRWAALALALLALVVGLFAATKKSGVQPALAQDDRKQALAQAIVALDRERDKGEVGPEFHREERARLIDELSAMVRDEAQAARAR